MRQTHLMRAATSLGIQVHDRMPETGIDLVVYSHGTRTIPVLEGRYDDQLRARDFFLTEDKYATKLLLDQAGFATPAGFVFQFGGSDCSGSLDRSDRSDEVDRSGSPGSPGSSDHSEDDARVHRFAEEVLTEMGGSPVVVKPRDGMRGDAVRMNLATADAVVAHMSAWRHRFPSWIIEEQVDGHDLRLQIVGDELVAACVRKPAYVTGDGQTPLDALIEEHRAKIKAANPGNRLVIDTETEDLLKDQSLELKDTPIAGRVVRLKNSANLAKGAVAVDVTDALHPDFAKWASSVAELFDTKILAIDAICTSPDQPPGANVKILEVNTAPEWVHHTCSDNGTHDIAARILRYWFDL
ncbi:hypothetical protein AB0I49_29625 [Streptomyces sp. NPDC050617]|uniref:hypothetical protein n=1 Tax=Streptomyces sp. NPDC050617 TaxID=3154628 RepID=UPI003436A5BB